MNYSSNKGKPRKGGKLSDAVKPKKQRYSRVSTKTKLETIDLLKIDLVRVLADLGITLSNTHTIASKLESMGWTKVKKIEKDTP